jgi:hypothetical protein
LGIEIIEEWGAKNGVWDFLRGSNRGDELKRLFFGFFIFFWPELKTEGKSNFGQFYESVPPFGLGQKRILFNEGGDQGGRGRRHRAALRRTSTEDEEAIQYATSYAFEAERRMGKMLLVTERADGGRPKKTGNVVLPVSSTPTLSDLGVTKRESSQAQVLASIPRKIEETG